MYGIRENLYNEIINTIKKFGIKKAIIFGSRARGDYKNNSDIDLAIIFNNDDKDNFIKLQTKLEELETLYKFDIIDFSSLKDEKLKKEIKKEGIIIFQD
ncbi:MAG: nucleotidyltransferase domain-containing protein [Bacilli bacterium]|jgi:DNA polymerase beta domain protein region|nr:nucleotidyltransferase domain-containing protein [Bacilli bacterium]